MTKYRDTLSERKLFVRIKKASSFFNLHVLKILELLRNFVRREDFKSFDVLEEPIFFNLLRRDVSNIIIERSFNVLEESIFFDLSRRDISAIKIAYSNSKCSSLYF